MKKCEKILLFLNWTNYSTLNSHLYIDISLLIFRILLLAILEFLKMSYGQNLRRTTLDVVYYLFFLLSIGMVRVKINNIREPLIKISILSKFKVNFFFLFILIIDISELISWNFIKAPINNQVINAASFKVIIEEYPNFLYYIFFIIPLCLFILLFPFLKMYINVCKISIIIHQFHFIFMFLFVISILHDFHDENNVVLYESTTYDYDYYFKKLLWLKINQKPKVLKKAKQLKNLIQIQLESYPSELVENPIISPNLFNLSQSYEYISPIYVQPYSGWTIGALIILQIGIPQIMPDTSWLIRSGEKIDYMLRLQGMPDILGSLGYNLHLGTVGFNNVMGFSKWEKSRNFTRIYSAKDDKDLYNYFTNEYLPKIDKDTRESNYENKYMTLISNVETHTPYFTPKWCNLNFDHIDDEKQRCFHCIDNLVGEFVRKFMDLKMYEHSILVIYPDHCLFNDDTYNKLFFLFPSVHKNISRIKIKDEVTYYDYAPTILNLIGVKKFVPEFPFGRNIYDFNNNLTSDSNSFQKHSKPDIYDMQMIYKFLHFDIGKNISGRNRFKRVFKCYIKNGKSYTISYKPCNISD